MPSQTFVPSPKKLVGPAITVLAFFAWGITAFAVVPRETSTGFGFAFVAGLPLAMGVVSLVLLLGLFAKTTVDDDGLLIVGPLGRRSVRWSEVVGHDVVGTAKQGVTLYLANGKRLGVPFLAYDGDPRRAIDVYLRRLPKPDVEGREFYLENRRGFSALFVGVLGLFAIAAATMPAGRQGQIWILLGLMAAMLLPMIAFMLSDRVKLAGGVLEGRNVFGSRRIALADVLRAELRIVNGKGGAREVLVLKGAKEFRLTANREGYAMLRDAVIRELPAAVRPKPLA